ncbi:hypothetical protein GCM10009609_74020 [Pseudonocardia aurantiaca]
MIRDLLADDQALVGGALAAMLGLETDIEVVAQVGSGAEVVPAALRTVPDVALLDVQMPGGDGLDAAAALHEALPACRVLMLTTFGRPGYLARAMRRRGEWVPGQGRATRAARRRGAPLARRAPGRRPGARR